MDLLIFLTHTIDQFLVSIFLNLEDNNVLTMDSTLKKNLVARKNEELEGYPEVIAPLPQLTAHNTMFFNSTRYGTFIIAICGDMLTDLNSQQNQDIEAALEITDRPTENPMSWKKDVKIVVSKDELELLIDSCTNFGADHERLDSLSRSLDKWIEKSERRLNVLDSMCKE